MGNLNKRIAFAVVQAAVSGDKEKALYFRERMYEPEGMEVELQIYDLTPEQQKELEDKRDFETRMDIGICPFTLSI